MNPTEHAITEDDIANYLANSPDFFERHAELLASVQLSSGHGNRVISLQERQAGMLREKIKALESRVVDMIRHGRENATTVQKLQRWASRLLQTASARELPAVMVDGMASEFQVPQAVVKVWNVSQMYAAESFTTGISSDAKTFSASLETPYCGVNSGFEVVNWLPDPANALSIALIPLRAAAGAPVSGLLVLASSDSQRFESSMGTDFLQNMGELASAALSRLQAPQVSAE